MKRFLSVVAIVLISLSLVLSILLLLGSEKPFETIVFLETHSYTQLSENETFELLVLASENHPMYFEPKYIIHAQIEPPSLETFFPVKIVSIESSHRVTLNHQAYTMMRLQLQPVLLTENYAVNIENAQLRIEYLNHETLILELGEFNYYYPRLENSQLFIHRQHVIHETMQSVPSSVGLVLGIENRYQAPITITSIDINSCHIRVNMPFIKYQETLLERFDSLEHWLNYPYDLYRSKSSLVRTITLQANEDVLLVIPFKYNEFSHPLFRFPIIIHYELANQQKATVMNDFLYINTDRFIDNSEHLKRQTHD